jgi:hypothetical protein
MRIRPRHLLLCTTAILIASLVLLLPRQGFGVGSLSGTWRCGTSSSCSFQRTSSQHATYQWYFGDGTSSGLTTAVTTWHTYSTPTPNIPYYFTAYLVGYATPNGGNPDNIVTCNVTAMRTTVGGDPTSFSGNCS